jgi:hypothetical protein
MLFFKSFLEAGLATLGPPPEVVNELVELVVVGTVVAGSATGADLVRTGESKSSPNND